MFPKVHATPPSDDRATSFLHTPQWLSFALGAESRLLLGPRRRDAAGLPRLRHRHLRASPNSSNLPNLSHFKGLVLSSLCQTSFHTDLHVPGFFNPSGVATRKSPPRRGPPCLPTLKRPLSPVFLCHVALSDSFTGLIMT